MEIKILGTGCAKCNLLKKAVNDMLVEQDIDAEVIMEDDIMKIMEYHVLRTPGLVIDGKLVLSGRIPSAGELRKIINQ